MMHINHERVGSTFLPFLRLDQPFSDMLGERMKTYTMAEPLAPERGMTDLGPVGADEVSMTCIELGFDAKARRT